MASYTQDNRPLRVSTTLGKDALLLERFSGEEAVSRPFHFTLEMLSQDPSIEAAELLRQPVRVEITLPGGGTRFLHGRISRFAQLGRRSGLTAYRADMVPWLWFLSLSTDCRIFQNLSVTEIAEQLFKEAGFSDFKIKVLKPLAKREYCVQYRETTLDFITRLLEEQGVFYFFEHEDLKHTLVLTDHGGKAPDCPVVGQLRMGTSDSYAMVEDPVVLSLQIEDAAITGSVSLNSFDYEHPSRVLLASVAGEQPNEIYDYFGGYTKKADGDRYARLRLEQKESERQIIRGESNCASLTSGHKFDLVEHPNHTANQDYHLLEVRHAAAISNYVTGNGAFDYSATFDAIPTSVPYRPRLHTPRPSVRGTQTAIVTGPAGEEIYTDKLGRVKVHFHWDRRNKFDENSSCWVRVSSAWAGKGYGNFSVPRIGQEVIVDFLEGDPDQPIIVGRVYNGEQTPPCDPGKKGGVISGLKSKTHKGSGYNEMSMDDTPGKERVTVHAQYDMTTTVGHDETHSVVNNRTTKVDVDDKETIGNNQTVAVAVNQELSVGSNRKTTIGANETLTVGGNIDTKVGGNEARTVGGKRTLGIGGADAITVGGGRKTSVTGADALTITANGTMDVGGALSITAATEIKLSVGGSTVTIAAGGVTISAPKVDVIGSGPVTVTGAIVKVNS